MEYLIVGGVALLASGLTLVSGFGLGTLLLPAFLLFFPAEAAVAMTGVVHLLNNLFKLILVGRGADLRIVVRFGLPAVLAAFAGAALLVHLAGLDPLFSYEFAGATRRVLRANLLIAPLIALFGAAEFVPSLRSVQFDPRYLPLGGLLSGLFGGLSGHQGALRSAFLIRLGLDKSTFIATGVTIVCLIDFTRVSVTRNDLRSAGPGVRLDIMIVATLAAFCGALGRSAARKRRDPAGCSAARGGPPSCDCRRTRFRNSVTGHTACAIPRQKPAPAPPVT